MIQLLTKVPVFNEFHHHMQMFWSLKSIVKSQYIGVTKLLHNFSLSDSVLNLIVSYKELLFHALHRIRLACVLFYHPENFTKWAFTQQLNHIEISKFDRCRLNLIHRSFFLPHCLLNWLSSALEPLFVMSYHFEYASLYLTFKFVLLSSLLSFFNFFSLSFLSVDLSLL